MSSIASPLPGLALQLQLFAVEDIVNHSGQRYQTPGAGRRLGVETVPYPHSLPMPSTCSRPSIGLPLVLYMFKYLRGQFTFQVVIKYLDGHKNILGSHIHSENYLQIGLDTNIATCPDTLSGAETNGGV